MLHEYDPYLLTSVSHVRSEISSAFGTSFWSSKPSTHGTSFRLAVAFDFAMTTLGRERSFFRFDAVLAYPEPPGRLLCRHLRLVSAAFQDGLFEHVILIRECLM